VVRDLGAPTWGPPGLPAADEVLKTIDIMIAF
jgi:hypothetical protein